MDDLAVDFRCRALVEGREAQDRMLADVNLVDVLRGHLGIDDQRIGIGHDQHERFAGLDDAADRVDVALEHPAVLRRHEIDALELIVGRYAALGHLGLLGPDLGQFLADLGAEILVDLVDLQFQLGDAATVLRQRRHERRPLAFHPGRVALQLRDAADRHEVLLPERADTLQFLREQLQFLALGGFLRLNAFDLQVELLDLLAQLGFLAVACGAAHLEQFLLAAHQARDFGIFRA